MEAALSPKNRKAFRRIVDALNESEERLADALRYKRAFVACFAWLNGEICLCFGRKNNARSRSGAIAWSGNTFVSQKEEKR